MGSSVSRSGSACLLLVLLAVAAGCASTAPPYVPSPPPPPVADLDGDGWIVEDSFYEKEVSYATSRVDRCARLSPMAEGSTLQAYERCAEDPERLDTGNDKTNAALAYGTAIVRIPLDKAIGGTKGMSLTSVDHDIPWDTFAAGISDSDVLVFVHGYNTNFSNAAVRAAQLAHDTNFPGEALLFSWPSKETWVVGTNYDEDKERASENFTHLADFLQQVATATDKKIHVVAHSMGTYLLMNSLAILDKRLEQDRSLLANRRNGGQREIFAQIILAAPDIAQRNYREVFSAHDLGGLAEKITLYSAVNDYVLKSSRIINRFVEGTSEARLGDSSKAFVVLEGMDTIDTRKEISPQFFGHSFYANYRSLVADMHLLLNYGAEADGRMLQKVRDNAGNELWFIRN